MSVCLKLGKKKVYILHLFTWFASSVPDAFIEQVVLCSIEDIVVNRQKPRSYRLTGGLKGETRCAHFLCVSTNGLRDRPDTEMHQWSKDKQCKKNL